MFAWIPSFSNFSKKYATAVFVTNNQYRLRFLDFYRHKRSDQFIAVLQVIIKRIKIKLSLKFLASNKYLLQDIHPVDACRISFLANFLSEQPEQKLPDYIKTRHHSCPIIKQPPTIQISQQYFCTQEQQTIFVLKPTTQINTTRITANDLAKNPHLLYSIGSYAAASVGHAASNDLLRATKVKNTKSKKENLPQQSLYFYPLLCMMYVALLLSGLSIVRRFFPFHIPFTDVVVPFGAGILFFPLTFTLQDITTEVYGYKFGRQMTWFSIFMIIFYTFYTWIATHLPSGHGALYAVNHDFDTVFSLMPRQLFALIISLFIGNIINDIFISKSKIIFAGQHLWARLLGSTMIGEAVLQVVGGIIGFAGTLNFTHQLLPNMALAYGYKLLWNAAMIPFIYLITNYLKKKENIDVYDYDVNYNPFSMSSSDKRS